MLTLAERTRLLAEGDVHVRIWLGDTAFDFRAAFAAAMTLIRDWHRKHWCAIELFIHQFGNSLPEKRLPNERLFLDPQPRQVYQ